MKVFAQFYSINGIEIRRNTVLQFGESWEPIAAVWLINPGSSGPIGDIGIYKETLSQINNSHSWNLASIDPTMRFLEKILKGNYVGNNRPLNGVVKLFNLFNLREPNLQKALSIVKNQNSIEEIVSIKEDIASLGDVTNIYLGWGNVGKSSGREYSQLVWDSLSTFQKRYYDIDYDKNKFYHPMFVNRGIRYNSTKEWLNNYEKHW